VCLELDGSNAESVPLDFTVLNGWLINAIPIAAKITTYHKLWAGETEPGVLAANQTLS
jgi:hypothetical protein